MRLVLDDFTLIVVFVLIELDLPINGFLVNLNDLKLSLLVDRFEDLFLIQVEAFRLHLGFDLGIFREDLLV